VATCPPSHRTPRCSRALYHVFAANHQLGFAIRARFKVLLSVTSGWQSARVSKIDQYAGQAKDILVSRIGQTFCFAEVLKLERNMRVEELIGSKVWIKSDRFRSVPGKIESMSNAVNLDDIQSSVAQSTFRIEMASGDVIEVLGSNISKIENAG
jgi:hypothetical protein